MSASLRYRSMTLRSFAATSARSSSNSSLGMAASPRGALGGRDLALIEDFVCVALFGQEHLAVVGEVEFAGVAGHERVEVGVALAGRLRPQDATQPLRLLLPRAERSGHLNQHVRVRQVDGEVADLR